MVKRVFLLMLMFSGTLLWSAPADDAFLGIGFTPSEKDGVKGVVVDSIIAHSAASKSALKEKDFIYMMDHQVFTSDNVGAEFKQYLKKEKAVGDALVLRVVRETMRISKKIKSQFVDVDFEFDDIKANLDSLGYKDALEFKFFKDLEKQDLEVVLDRKPFLLTSTPNLELDAFTATAYINPFYSSFFTHVKTQLDYGIVWDELTRKQLENEFWDTGFRLKANRYLHVNPDKLPAFTTVLRQSLLSHSFSGLLDTQAMLWDVSTEKPTFVPYPAVDDDFDVHMTFIKTVFLQSQSYLDQAFLKISVSDKAFLYDFTQNLVPALETSFVFSDSSELSSVDMDRFMTICKQVDFKALYQGSVILNQLQLLSWLDQFYELAQEKEPVESLLTETRGFILHEEKTASGIFVIGSDMSNVYTSSVALIMDVGGNDIYRNNAGGYVDGQAINAVVDFSGDDVYSSTALFSQGAAFMGVGLLLDLSGVDIYRSKGLSQAVSVLGVAALVDMKGDDSYQASRFSQGLALMGLSSLVDYRGDDQYHAEYFSQGVGMPNGIGALVDYSGNDRYFSGASLDSSYGSKGVFKSASQGFGFGFRSVVSGGIGLMFDEKGDDRYESGNFSLGTGYAYGMGILFNHKGHDRYLGARYSMGASAHSAIGIFSESSGHDSYRSLYGTSIGVSWDYSNAYFVDQAGNDVYDCMGSSFCLASSDHNSFAFFNDKKGADTYKLASEKSRSTNTYDGGKSLAILLDENGGKDVYQALYKNNVINNADEQFLFLDLEKSLLKFVR